MRTVAIAIVVAIAASVARADRVLLVAGGGAGGDGSTATDVRLAAPFGVAHDAGGRLLVIEYSGHRLRAIGADDRVVTLAGDGTKGDGGDGGPATAARLNAPHAIAVGADGAVYIADSLNHKVRRIDPKTGAISTFAGTTKGYDGDGGPASAAKFSGIYCIAFNPARDRMIVTDLDNRRVRAIDMTSGVVTLIAGNGAKGLPADGAAAADAPLVDPRAATMDSKGNVYLLERGGHALRVVDPAGKIRTLIAGPADARAAKTLAGPKHLCVDKDDNVIIADTDHHRIVKWLAGEAKLVPVAGTGTKGVAGVGGPPDRLQLNQPHGVYLDSRGTLYISDSNNARVLRVEP